MQNISHPVLDYWKSNCSELASIPELTEVVVEVVTKYDDGVCKKFLGNLSRFDPKHRAGDIDAQLEDLITIIRELTSMEHPQFAFIAARFAQVAYARKLNEVIRESEHAWLIKLETFTQRVQFMYDQKLYWNISECYSYDEIEAAYKFIDNSRDRLLDYAAFDLLTSRYTIRNHDGDPLETVQEMFLGIALYLASREDKAQRLEIVKSFYDVLSELKLTVATPTLSNARKPYHQLSSCFVDTVPDSLSGIYRSVDNFARISKLGGGMGMYMGKIRGSGGSIRGFKGAAGGVIPWVRLINSTAVAVDQLGMRQGAVAVYLDIWHYDILNFTQLRTNNGDDRMKAHDVFPAISVPDHFWRLLEEDINNEWTLVDPHSVKVVLGYDLSNYYGEAWSCRYLEACEHPKVRKKTIIIKDLIKMIIKSLVETGTPFIFNRDTVNELNPNRHVGMIYSSNLCTEIAQNMSEILDGEYVADPGTKIVTQKNIAGDFVVCNLASLVLPRIVTGDDEDLRSTVRTAIRMLDNVIDLNYYPIPYALITNQEYRSLGLGVSGYHHLLALKNIDWESQAHLDYVDELFEKINYYAIEASSDLAVERDSYKFFRGSDWDTGEYFTKRKYLSEQWQELANKVHEQGMRNGYLLAIAPTSSTSIIANTTAGIDPVMKKYFLEEKKSGLLPRVAPDLGPATMWYYKNAHKIDQTWSIKACGIRQRHIDQAQSMNFYITNDTTMRTILNYYLEAWKQGVKTVYYVRSTALEVEECESCAS